MNPNSHHASTGIHWTGIALAVLIAVAMLYWLPLENAPKKGVALLALIAVLWLTEAIPLAVTALVVPLAALALQIPGLSTPKAFAPFADPIVFLFLGGFVLATALRVQQLDTKLATGLLRMARGHLGGAVMLLFAATALLSMAISNTATAAMMLPLAMGILAPLNDTQDQKTRVFVLLGVAYAASVGGIGTLVGSPPNAIAAKAANLDFAQWLKIGIPLVLVLMPVMVAALWWVLRPELQRRIDYASLPIPWNRHRVLTLCIFVLTAAGWILGAEPLKAMGIAQPDTVVAVAAAVAVVLGGVARWDDVVLQTDWGVLLLFGGGLALGEALGASGASLVLGEQLASALAGTSAVWIFLAICVFMVLLSEFASNTAAAALLIPVFASVASQMGLPTEGVVVLVALAASCGFALPVATPPNALVFGTGQIPSRQMLMAGGVFDLCCIIVLTIWAAWFVV